MNELAKGDSKNEIVVYQPNETLRGIRGSELNDTVVTIQSKAMGSVGGFILDHGGGIIDQ